MTTAESQRLRLLIDTVDPPYLPALTEELVRSLDLPGRLPEGMPIAEVAAITGVSAHTLRYYERIGLVDVPRDVTGRRIYDSQALGRVVFLTRLRLSDMSVRDIQHYLTWWPTAKPRCRSDWSSCRPTAKRSSCGARPAGLARRDRLQDHHVRRALRSLDRAGR
ncbi:MAG: MerR family transcriptional regulator [Geodermatophilaceae bacterium]